MHLESYLILQHLHGLSKVLKHAMLKHYESVETVLRRPELQPFYHLWGKRDWDGARAFAEAEIVQAEKEKVTLIAWDDPHYPQLLKCIDDPPFVLYAKGRIEHMQNDPKLAMVGSRNADSYGLQAATKLAQELSEAGVTIVSGLALGIDGRVHQAALSQVRPTIGVLGCGIDVIYPPNHRDLFNRMSEQGLIISELPFGAPPLPDNFPQRNRLISGLSHGTLVVQAALKSGALITARLAAEQGRLVFAVPQPIFSATGKGANQLLRQGATAIVAAADILEAIIPQYQPAIQMLLTESQSSAKRSSPSLNHTETKLVDALVGGVSKSVEHLVEECGLSVTEVLAHLSQLQVNGAIQQSWDGNFALKI